MSRCNNEPPHGRLYKVPVTQREAFAFIERHHRHHAAPRGAKCQVAAALDGEIVGVIVVGRPVSRVEQAGDWTAEAIRCCTLGTRNACSFLYSAAWALAKALGYRRCITYTLPGEGGASLRAAGWRCLGEAGGGAWDRIGRPRVDTHPTQKKLKWEVGDLRPDGGAP